MAEVSAMAEGAGGAWRAGRGSRAAAPSDVGLCARIADWSAAVFTEIEILQSQRTRISTVYHSIAVWPVGLIVWLFRI